MHETMMINDSSPSPGPAPHGRKVQTLHTASHQSGSRLPSPPARPGGFFRLPRRRRSTCIHPPDAGLQPASNAIPVASCRPVFSLAVQGRTTTTATITHNSPSSSGSPSYSQLWEPPGVMRAGRQHTNFLACLLTRSRATLWCCANLAHATLTKPPIPAPATFSRTLARPTTPALHSRPD